LASFEAFGSLVLTSFEALVVVKNLDSGPSKTAKNRLQEQKMIVMSFIQYDEVTTACGETP
jgi:hypothetical protein